MTNVVYEQAVFVLRLFLACVCGGMVGYERTNRGKGAGIRTHSIVALASALMMIISKYGFYDITIGENGTRGADVARIAAQVVSGVGFLGAGMIYFNRSHSVKGLTTAAGIWATAGVGLALGAGMYIMGIVSSVMVVMLQIFLHKNLKILQMPNEEILNIVIDDSKEALSYLNSVLSEYGIVSENVKFSRKKDDLLEIEMHVNVPSELDYKKLIEVFCESKYVKSASI